MSAVSRPASRLTVAAVVLLAACGPAAEGEPTPSAATSQVPITMTPSASVSPSDRPSSNAAATASPTAEWSAELAPDTMVRTTIEGVTLRAAPGLDQESLGILPAGSRSFVVGQPTAADGYEWVLLSGPGLPPASGCATFPGPELSCPVWFGWAATGDPASRTAWFEPDPMDCPDPASDTEAFMALGDVQALACYGDRELEFTAWLPDGGLNTPRECPTRTGRLAWLTCTEGNVATVVAAPDLASSLELYAEPGSAEFTDDGYWAIITGRLDHPASQGCDDEIAPGHPIEPAAAVLECRTNFVVTRHGAVAP